MIAMIFIYVVVSAFSLGMLVGFDLSIFNPIRNYNKWRKMNWFGVIITTLILNILLFPYAIIYWLVYKLFTVGRK